MLPDSSLVSEEKLTLERRNWREKWRGKKIFMVIHLWKRKQVMEFSFYENKTYKTNTFHSKPELVEMISADEHWIETFSWNKVSTPPEVCSVQLKCTCYDIDVCFKNKQTNKTPTFLLIDLVVCSHTTTCIKSTQSPRMQRSGNRPFHMCHIVS